MTLKCDGDGSPESGQDRFVQLNGLLFHYVEWGAPDAPPLVLLHGLRSYARTFEPLASVLSGSFRLLALDQRGRGQTAWDPGRNYYTDQYVADLAAFVDALDLGRFHLLGHSLGGINALAYSQGNPQRLLTLVLEDYGPGANQAGAGTDRIRRELENTPLRFDGWDEATAFWRRARPGIAPHALQSRLRHSLKETEQGIVWRHDQAGIAQTRLHPDPNRLVPDLWPAVDALACPTLVVRGQNSDYLRADVAQRMAARNANIVLASVENAGHYVHDDNPDDFHRVVQAFLARYAFP